MARIVEQQKVCMVLEPLNSEVAENMKGHPGYQGDHIETVSILLYPLVPPI
ncbi:MAG: hypothetical protein ACJA01_000727 [Saprospiraceae bacterium]|jgi:hypothetical protein